jgi:multidrug efflux pump subunit AcrA (membrane-fusion protein)
MLVTATFLAPPRASGHQQESENDKRLLIPRRLVLSEGDGTFVWLVTADGTARRQTIELGKAGTEDLVEVVAGIRATDKLIASGHQGLESGTRVTISGEDAPVGVDNEGR